MNWGLLHQHIPIFEVANVKFPVTFRDGKILVQWTLKMSFYLRGTLSGTGANWHKEQQSKLQGDAAAVPTGRKRAFIRSPFIYFTRLFPYPLDTQSCAKNGQGWWSCHNLSNTLCAQLCMFISRRRHPNEIHSCTVTP